jgi:hypothetical protein
VELARLVDEAVLLQELAEDMLAGIRARRSLAELAPPCGALVSRFVALRAQVPECADAQLVRETLDHHAMLLSTSLALLGDYRPERVAHLIDTLDGMGAPAERLLALQERLSGRRTAAPAAAGTPPAC